MRFSARPFNERSVARPVLSLGRVLEHFKNCCCFEAPQIENVKKSTCLSVLTLERQEAYRCLATDASCKLNL